MVTALMAILSGVDTRTLKVSTPIDFTYLSARDYNTFEKSIAEIGAILNNEDIIATDEDGGNTSLLQFINNEVVEINPYTALVVDLARECYAKWRIKDSVESVTDLSDNDILTRIGHNPDHVYRIVFSIMKGNANKSYESRVQMINNILVAIEQSDGVLQIDGLSSDNCDRLLDLSTISFWQKLLYTKYVERYGTLPALIDTTLIDTITRELGQLGLYGFTNPYLMYQKLKDSRVMRQNAIRIPDSVLVYLRHCVRSGGIR